MWAAFMRDSKKRLSSETQHVLRDCPSGNSSIAREQRRSTPRKLEYALSRQLGRGRLGGGPHPFDLAQSPRVHSGWGFFLRSARLIAPATSGQFAPR